MPKEDWVGCAGQDDTQEEEEKDRGHKKRRMEGISSHLTSIDGLYFPGAIHRTLDAPQCKVALLDLLSCDTPIFLERYGSELNEEREERRERARYGFEHEGVLRHVGRRSSGGVDRDRAICGRGAMHRRELLGIVHEGEGRGALQEAVALQGIDLLSCDPGIHVPGWRLHHRERDQRRVNLRYQVHRRELREVHGTRRAIDGTCGAEHERVSVLYLHSLDLLA